MHTLRINFELINWVNPLYSNCDKTIHLIMNQLFKDSDNVIFYNKNQHVLTTITGNHIINEDPQSNNNHSNKKCPIKL